MKCRKMQFTVKIVHLLDFSCSYQTMWNFPRLNVYNWVGERLFLIHNIAVVALIRASPVGLHDLHFRFNPDQKYITWKYHKDSLAKTKNKIFSPIQYCYQIGIHCQKYATTILQGVVHKLCHLGSLVRGSKIADFTCLKVI